MSPCSTVAVKIRQSEKKVLHNAVLFARTLKESLLNQPIEPEAYGVNGSASAHEMTQPTGNLGGATDNVPVVLEIDSEGGEHEAKQPTGNMAAGATGNIIAGVVELDDEVSSDHSGDEPEHEVQQTTGNLVGAANNTPVVVEIENEASSETSSPVEPREAVESEQVNGEVDDELCDEKGEEGERDGATSEEEEEGREEVVEIKGAGGGDKVEAQGGGCHDDEGGGSRGGVSQETDLEQVNQCVNGNV